MVRPKWNGETPAGITAVVRSSTSVVFAVPRIFMDDTAEDQPLPSDSDAGKCGSLLQSVIFIFPSNCESG